MIHPDIGLKFCQSSLACVCVVHHKQFNSLQSRLELRTLYEHNGSPLAYADAVAIGGAVCSGCVRLVAADRRASPGCLALAKGMHAAVRLLAGSRSGPVLLGGIAVQLDPGWKTYWRTSGDSGVPPRFDFSKSDNVEAVTVLWPAPAKFDDGAGGFSLGYHDQVVLPLRIVPKSNDKPVTLRANINYAVCEKICIPGRSECGADLCKCRQHRRQRRCLRRSTPFRSRRRSAIPIRSPFATSSARASPRCWSTCSRPMRERSICLSKVRLRIGGCRFQNFSSTDRPALNVLPSSSTASRREPTREGAALKLTLVGGDRSYEFNINLE